MLLFRQGPILVLVLRDAKYAGFLLVCQSFGLFVRGSIPPAVLTIIISIGMPVRNCTIPAQSTTDGEEEGVESTFLEGGKFLDVVIAKRIVVFLGIIVITVRFFFFFDLRIRLFGSDGGTGRSSS